MHGIPGEMVYIEGEMIYIEVNRGNTIIIYRGRSIRILLYVVKTFIFPHWTRFFVCIMACWTSTRSRQNMIRLAPRSAASKLNINLQNSIKIFQF